ncbi:DUF560 domain-containing protein [Salmonella enterica]|uniref:DUF560 domain-containing protein n=1 Tax=Salmonella diarizonae TaxID=59204 RepID=A0A6Y1R0I3_SALDZ|nr:hypothetical protein [Salmonella enterica subsp. diarizonae]EAM7369227.1 DUF560 domain-containing protein [Salmonella enterica]EBH8037551.1 DUF560 domain-containing protein [Salmonella bongori]EAO1753749.1 DUF560 domain-containing protein [Salmonella enterica]EAS6961990.1 DUF560 domain-containing protein [Salmonella enterica]
MKKTLTMSPPSGRTIGKWRPGKPQSGKGLLYWGEAEKTLSLPDNLFGVTRLTVSGKIYWNNHSYDELSGSTGVGLGYRNVNTMIQIIPFYEKKLLWRWACVK